MKKVKFNDIVEVKFFDKYSSILNNKPKEYSDLKQSSRSYKNCFVLFLIISFIVLLLLLL